MAINNIFTFGSLVETHNDGVSPHVRARIGIFLAAAVLWAFSSIYNLIWAHKRSSTPSWYWDFGTDASFTVFMIIQVLTSIVIILSLSALARDAITSLIVAGLGMSVYIFIHITVAAGKGISAKGSLVTTWSIVSLIIFYAMDVMLSIGYHLTSYLAKRFVQQQERLGRIMLVDDHRPGYTEGRSSGSVPSEARSHGLPAYRDSLYSASPATDGRAQPQRQIVVTNAGGDLEAGRA